MNRSLVVALLLLAPGAYAQSTSDLMPSLPTPSSGGGGGGYYYPGMPVPQPRGASGDSSSSGSSSVSRSGEGGARGDAAETGRRSYEIYDTPGTVSTSNRYGSSWDNRGHAEAVPEIHVVRRGDTLWDIAGYYFRNPWSWPKLWALNPTITNPHWIYPGDIVRLMKEGVAAPTPMTPVASDAPRSRIPARTDGVFLRQTGFVEPEELKSAGTLIGSKEEKLMLSTNDEGYVEMSKERPLNIGERYTVYRPIEEVRHPVTGKKIGVLVQILGEADVKSITDGKMARVKIIDSTDPIERGYRVGPLRRQFKIVEPVPNAGEHEGVVVVNLRPLNLVAADQITFVDLGKKDGVSIGNRLFVTRRGDGVTGPLETKPIDDPKYPREIVGEILVIDTRDHISTGLVTKSLLDSHIGDRVEAHKGY